MRRRLAGTTAAILGAAVLLASGVRAELPRRIGVSAACTYYVLDEDFFDLGDAVGVGAAFRYELSGDIYFENSLGFFGTEGSLVDVTGLDARFNLVALFPVLIPYRPIARCGVGFMSVNPITVTPTESFRPAQTTFYLCGGAGLTRSLYENVLVQMEATFWVTPYRYRVYRFNRLDVTVSEERFAHVGLSLGAVYTF